MVTIYTDIIFAEIILAIYRLNSKAVRYKINIQNQFYFYVKLQVLLKALISKCYHFTTTKI